MRNTLATLRSSRQPVTRLLAALFVAVWLNMALAPCLMAAEALMPDGMAGCDHCPRPADPPCHDGAGQDTGGRCSWVDGYDYDGRMPALAKLAPDLAVAPPPAPPPAVPATMRAVSVPLPAVPAGRAGPPLYLEHCSFLN